MSNQERKANLPDIIRTVEPRFTQLARVHNLPDFTFERECSFAIQIIKENEYLAQVACGNPDSLKEAVLNVAAIGLSLSPVHKQAYLVPRVVRRKPKVCLDISYRGLLDLATSRGVILWAKAELVHDNDIFEYVGVNKEPKHSFNPFGDRGQIVGAYCVAKMANGDLLVDFMSIAEIYAIRDRSDSWKAYVDKKAHSTPWKTDEIEMIKKTMIKRAYKSWPKSVAREALDKAIDVSNSADSIDFNAENEEPPATTEAQPDPHREEGLELIRQMLQALERTEDDFVKHLCRTTNRKITVIDDLTNLEINQAVTFLEGLIEAQEARIRKLKEAKEKANENVG